MEKNHEQMTLGGQCPKCGGKLEFSKEWLLKGKGQKHGTTMKMYCCSQCDTSVRVPIRGEPKT